MRKVEGDVTDNRLWEDTTVVEPGITVQVLTQPAINFALVHNRVPLIAGLRVTNTSEAPLVDLTVTVRLHGNGPSSHRRGLASETARSLLPRTCSGTISPLSLRRPRT